MPITDHEPLSESSRRRLTELKGGDWWILGSTSYAVVDPTKPRTPSDLVQRFNRPRQLTDELDGSGWPPFRPMSGAVGFPEQWRYINLLIPQQDNEVVKGNEDFLDLLKKSRHGRSSVPDSRSFTGSNFASSANVHRTVSRGQSSFIIIPAAKASLRDTGNSSTTVQYHAKVPSFRAIVRQLQEDAQRHRLREVNLLANKGQSTERVPSIQYAAADSAVGIARTSSMGGKDGLNARNGTGTIAFDASASIGSSTDSLFHKLARERLKRSFTRLATRMSSSVSHTQIEQSENEANADYSDPGVADLYRRTVGTLKQLKEGAHLLYKEMHNLQRAAEIAEKLAPQLKPELDTNDGEAGSEMKPSNLRSGLVIGSLQLLGIDIKEPHAAMTDNQLQEMQKAAEAARQQRLLHVETLQRLHEHLVIACECHEKFRTAPPSVVCSALSTIDTVAERWVTWEPHAPLFLPVALAALACTMAYNACTVGSTEVAAQTLASLLLHDGSKKAAQEVAERSFRHSLMNDSMLEHRKLIEGVVVRMLALVLDHDMPKPAPRTSSQLQVPPGQRTPAVVTRTENVLGNLAAEQVSTSSCFFSVVSVAQQAIVAIHEAGGRRGDPVSLVREAERHRDPRIAQNERALLQKLEFAFLELRLNMNKLLALRLALSELGCTQQAWDKINEFNTRIKALSGEKGHTDEQAD
ncbi:hypothetical protein, conserved [Eimeria maxima]|uniref:Uncharacterized protein n=1 Tax=Eimeria maxima TaxID=5804 RepID=U6MGR0_EIMMA|nr:hypothetical protein, conserved [Eimeria maxima]CDJ61634.1 hypothetical protein, conserved [Eimeria maxima]